MLNADTVLMFNWAFVCVWTCLRMFVCNIVLCPTPCRCPWYHGSTTWTTPSCWTSFLCLRSWAGPRTYMPGWATCVDIKVLDGVTSWELCPECPRVSASSSFYHCAFCGAKNIYTLAPFFKPSSRFYTVLIGFIRKSIFKDSSMQPSTVTSAPERRRR